MERLVFGYGTGRHQGEAPARTDAFEHQAAPEAAPIAADVKPRYEPRDWAFLGLMAFRASARLGSPPALARNRSRDAPAALACEQGGSPTT